VVCIEEDLVGRSPYQSEKRRKEIARLKKQEEKRQRRFNKKHEGESPEGQVEGMAPDVGMDAGDHPVEGSHDNPPPGGETMNVVQEPEKGTDSPS
jgi:hypothetical protein